MTQDITTEKSPKKIAVLAFGGVGKDTMNNLRNQYPDAELVVYNRESKTGTGAAILSHQAEIAEYAGMTAQEREKCKTIKGGWRYTNDVKDAVSEADFAIVAGGPARKDGESREDLIARSVEFLNSIIPDIKSLKEADAEKINKTIWLLGTNPLDLMAPYFAKETGIDPKRLICPLGGELDFVRLSQSISLQLRDYYNKDIKPWQIQGVEVIGEHGPNDMIPVFSNIKVDVKGDGNFQKLLDLKTEDNQRVVDQIVSVPNPKTGKKEERTMLTEFERATKEGGTVITNLLGSSNPETSGIINAYVIKRIVNAMNGGECKHFNASFPVEGHEGVFLSQRLQATKDGNIEVVDRKANGCELDDTTPVITRERKDPTSGAVTTEMITEKAAWDEAITKQEIRWKKLPDNLEQAKKNAEENSRKRSEVIASFKEMLAGSGHKALLLKAQLTDFIGTIFGQQSLNQYNEAISAGAGLNR